MNHTHKLTENNEILKFMLGGNSTFTFKNSETGNRFTYRIRKSSAEDSPHFVQVMVGSDNEISYKYLGVIFKDGNYVYGTKSKIGRNAQSAKVFKYIYDRLYKGTALNTVIEVWHEGRCGRCGRKLTVPESIKTGFGPECSKLI